MTGLRHHFVLLLTLVFAGSAAAADKAPPKASQVQKPPAVKTSPKRLTEKLGHPAELDHITTTPSGKIISTSSPSSNGSSSASASPAATEEEEEPKKEEHRPPKHGKTKSNGSHDEPLWPDGE